MPGPTPLFPEFRRRLVLATERLLHFGGRPFRRQDPGQPSTKPRIAILPLRPKPEGGHCFADGMTHALVELFSRSADLDVIAARSAMHFREEPPRLPDIAERLGVDFILSGSVQRTDDALRVHARLIHVESDSSLWERAWDGHPSDVFSIQSRITRSVGTVVKGERRVSDDESIYREPTSDLVAYDLFLQGRYHLARGTEIDTKSAVECYERAIERDPLFAHAWASLAECYVDALTGHASAEPAQSARRIGEACERALELDGGLPEAHVTLGLSELHLWNMAAAGEHFRRGLELAPGLSRAHQAYALYLLYRGDFSQSIEHAERAHALDPLSDTILNESARAFALSGQFDEALERSRRVIHRDPENITAYFSLGNYAEVSGRPEEAVTYYRAAAALPSRLPFITAFLGIALAEIGDRDEAEDIANDLERKAGRGSRVATPLAALLIRLGRIDEGLAWLEAAYDRREPLLLVADTHWLPLPEIRTHPEFLAILGRLPKPFAAGRRP